MYALPPAAGHLRDAHHRCGDVRDQPVPPAGAGRSVGVEAGDAVRPRTVRAGGPGQVRADVVTADTGLDVASIDERAFGNRCAAELHGVLLAVEMTTA